MSAVIRTMPALLAIAMLLALPAGSGRYASAQAGGPNDGDGNGAAPAASAAGPVRYSHSAHSARGVDHGACSSCHRLDSSFRVEPATKASPHQPCKTCHEAEFFATKPTICVVCHDGVEPWIQQPAVIRRRPTSEFSAGEFSHRSHLSGTSGKSGAPCMGCHGDMYGNGGDKEVDGPGHDRCARCHGGRPEPSAAARRGAAAAAPAMDQCGGCHGAATGAGDSGRAPASKWSVVTRFSHGSHGVDPRTGTTTGCPTCHQDVAGAATLAGVGRPTMRSCASCHNGEQAFKTTGFGCLRCHGKRALGTK